MDIRQPCGLEHPVRVAIFHPRDVVPDRPFKQRNRLRKIAGHAAEGAALPEIDIVAVQEDAARRGLEDADEQPRQRRFAGRGGADQPQHLAGGKGKGNALDDRHVHARRRVDQLVDDEVAV